MPHKKKKKNVVKNLYNYENIYHKIYRKNTTLQLNLQTYVMYKRFISCQSTKSQYRDTEGGMFIMSMQQ